jgi:hypothetical protein
MPASCPCVQLVDRNASLQWIGATLAQRFGKKPLK